MKDSTIQKKAAKLLAKINPPSGFRLLTPGNPKTVKGQKKGYMTFILHLAPARLSGYEVCPKRTPGCTNACLNVAGHGGLMAGISHLTYAMIESGIVNTVQAARIRRTKLYFENRPQFFAELIKDINKGIAWAKKHKLTPVFRLNGTSDIRFESVRIAAQNNKTIFDLFPRIQFYDYTKIENRRNIPANYDLTFSRADGNDAAAIVALGNGMRVAAVFRTRAIVERYMATGYNGFTVIDGDDSDLRFLEESGVIVGLYAKGPSGRKDTSGFVID